MADITLEFEKPIVELEKKLEEWKNLSQSNNIDASDEITALSEKLEHTKKEIYSKMTPWQRVQLARHPQRPYTLDYINEVFTDFLEFHGDRRYRDDAAIVGGFAKLEGQKVMVVGTQKGRDTKENVYRNFGCPHPEGYRKALRLMQMAEKANVPVITFIDTPGAFPGVASEERHIGEAIAVNLREMFDLKVPVICVVIGEGGSGGALGIGVGNKVLIMENSYYSVITPEGCAAILWNDRAYSEKAAKALKLSATDLLGLGIVDGVVTEPLGGAHRDYANAANEIKKSVLSNLKDLQKMSTEQLVEQRYQRFRGIEFFNDGSEV
ncbi:acetyl-CoA carboxylase carboxyltransferase subunit alpha [Lentisphaerota bacterium WC36G]|nr:acetyl-CoA carboxylase carboxyltransferase subunit alpha [Lentisphaerae bacterium WC36]